MSELKYTTTVKNDGRLERTYYVGSKHSPNRIGSSNRVNNWDSEEKTLNGLIKNGYNAQDIRRLSDPVIFDDKRIQIVSRYHEKDRNSSIQFQFYRDGMRIDTSILGYFPDKYQGFLEAHELAIAIVTLNLKEFIRYSRDGQSHVREIKPEFYKDTPEEGVCYDKEMQLQDALNEAGTELHELKSQVAELELENHKLKVYTKEQELLLNMYRNEYMWKEVVICPDCGAERYRLYSSEKGKYFVGCSSGKHHATRSYDKLARLCYEEGLLRDVWVENNEDPIHHTIQETLL